MKLSSFLLLVNHRLATSVRDFVNLTKLLVVEGKVVLMHVIKTSMWSGVMASVILNLSIRWRWVVNLTPPMLYSQGENPLYVSKRRLC